MKCQDASQNCCENEIIQENKSFQEQVDEKANCEDKLPRKVEEFSTCGCKENNKKIIEQPLCDCDKCQEDRRIKNSYFVTGGFKKINSNQIIPVIQGVQLKKPCKCREDYEKRIEEYEIEAKKLCHCTKENKKIIDQPLCDCDKCQNDRRRRNRCFVIGGVKETEGKGIIPIIYGIQLKKSCKCEADYEKKIKEYEDYQKRIEVVCEMKQRKDKYLIGGVVTTSKGPVYIISGMRSPIDCICAKQAREELAEKQRPSAVTPHIPPGRTKYEICGVKETPQGSVFILNRALPKEECGCTKMQNKIRKRKS